jgi:hypothetical protein
MSTPSYSHDAYLQRLFDELGSSFEDISVPRGQTPVICEERSEIADIRSISATYRAQGWQRPEAVDSPPAFDPTAIPGGAEVLSPRPEAAQRSFVFLGAVAAMAVMGLSFALAAVLTQAS